MDFKDLRTPTRLLVATDLSARSERALKRAILLADELGASLEVLHVIDDAMPARVLESYEGAARESVAQLLGTIPEATALKPRVTFIRGQGYREILLHAQENGTDLILLGITRHNLAALFTGTTAERIIRVGDIPVLMVKDAAGGAYQRVLVATDNSPSAARALFCALALSPKAKFCVVHVAHVPFKGMLGKQIAEEVREDRDRSFREKFSKQLSQATGALGIDTPEPSVMIDEGDIAHVIGRKISEFKPDLLVLGTHGRSSLGYALVGSLALKMLSDPPSDVLIAKG